MDGTKSFSQVVESERNNIISSVLDTIKPNKKGTPVDEVREFVTPREENLTFVYRDLPPHTFTPTTYHYVLTNIKNSAKRLIKEKVGDRHVWIQSVKGLMREAKDEEVLKNLFEGKKLTTFELKIRMWIW